MNQGCCFICLVQPFTYRQLLDIICVELADQLEKEIFEKDLQNIFGGDQGERVKETWKKLKSLGLTTSTCVLFIYWIKTHIFPIHARESLLEWCFSTQENYLPSICSFYELWNNNVN